MKMIVAGSVLLMAFSMFSCGRKSKSKPPIKPHGSEDVEQDDSSWKVRARWQLNYSSQVGNLVESFAGTSSTHVISTVVPAVIRFNVSEAALVPPVDPTAGEHSFGALKLDTLQDNKLTVCGANGTTQCTEAVLRVYTTGKPGAGLWNDVGNYGLPISTNGNVIGLDVSNSYQLAVTNVSALRTLKLSNFTSAPTLDIPLSVNFDDSGAGSYSASIVVEYALR